MREETIKKMQEIDTALVIGAFVSLDDKIFYNTNLEAMRDAKQSEADYWSNHTHLCKI